MTTAPVSRRRSLGVIATAAVVVLTGCSGGPSRAPAPRQPSPDERAVASSVLDEQRLVARYAQAALERPELAPRLASARAEHAEHLAALVALLPRATPSDQAAASPASDPAAARAASPSAGGSASSPAPARPATVVLADLAAAEASAVQDRLLDAGSASPGLARLLVSVCAAETVHARALGGRPAPAATMPAPATGAVSTPRPNGSAAASGGPALQSWQQALDAEHAAVWVYGLAGPHLAVARQGAARAAEALHRDRRDQLRATVRALGDEPAGPMAAYAVPVAPSSPATAAALLAVVESRLGDVLSVLAATTRGAQRTAAARWLADTAVRVTGWSGTTVAFPGMPERRAR